MSKISRRDFLKRSSAAVAASAIVSNSVLGKQYGHTAPSDTLRVLGVGIGGRGAGVMSDLDKTKKVQYIGLCDVDWKYAKHIFEKYPQAKRYKDFRVMYDELAKDADAVMCATADHTHAIVSATAIQLGKHVYCEKPLTHSVYEARLLNKLAEYHGVATQMGNQGASMEGTRTVCEWIQAGEIGEVTRVDAFTDRPIWPQGLPRPEGQLPHSQIDWDLFLGPAKYREYNEIYTPWNWRGWWDFGTGALGDMACHILQPVFTALNLGSPTKIQGSSTLLLTDCAPNAQTLKYTFPERPKVGKVKMPEVVVNWYDGGILPERPAGMPKGKSLNDAGGCCIFYGTKDILICGCYGVNPYLLSGRKPEVGNRFRKISPLSHQADWVEACMESKEARRSTASCFSKAAPLTEMIDMGVLAIRLQGLNQELEWNGEKMEFTNIDPNATIRICEKDGFTIKDGHPTFNKTWTKPINALAFSQEMIKHTYREGWTLPEMPK